MATKKVSKKTAKKAVKKTSKKVAKKTSTKTIKKAVKKVAKKAVKKPAVSIGRGRGSGPGAFLQALTSTQREVRERIISSGGGLGNTQPEDLEDDMSLTDNLNYTPTDFNILQGALDSYVKSKKSSARVTSTDISSNKTVGKIVAMVEKKII